MPKTLFNRSFFRFLGEFLAILSVSFVSLVLVSAYASQNESNLAASLAQLLKN